MNNDQRPDPDQILQALQSEELSNGKSQLRVFLGMSAGVGKTYAMLKAAHQKLAEGVDVVIGVVETHGRKDTLALVDGLPIIPLKKIDYRGTQIEEMDLEAIIKHKPQLVIVDELAHTNAPGLRHEKRYQDVYELLDTGINVYTALNVQHLESRKDSVEGVTGISIRETVPDGILDRANLVELVDIAPTELLKRLKEGKIYLGDKAHRAAENFFKEDKLTALREIALRMTAERVDQDLQKFTSVTSSSQNWKASEKLLVCISHSPFSERLIRSTRRLAYNLEAPWIALYVDTGLNLNDDDQAQLVKNLNLARELKAEVITTTDTDVAQTIQRICHQKSVTQVILGRPTRRWFRNLLEGGSLIKKLIRESPDLDVHVIRQDTEKIVRPQLSNEIKYYQPKPYLSHYGYVFLILAMTALLGFFLKDILGYKSVGFFFLLSVIVIGTFSSISAVAIAALTSALAWDFFFIPPYFTFAISNPDDILMTISFFVVAIITGFLTHRIRSREFLIRERENRTNILYEILQEITRSKSISEFLPTVLHRIGHLLDSQCAVALKNNSGQLDFSSLTLNNSNLAEKDQAVAKWCYENKKSAGWSTDTLSQSQFYFIPLNGLSESVGVFIFQANKQKRKLDLSQDNLLHSIVKQLGISLERHFIKERLKESQRLKDSEQLHQTLLNSISHEMRTPLTAILASSTALENEQMTGGNQYIKNIAHDLHESSERLNQVIENLLDMSRLDSGAMTLKLEWHDFNDLIHVVIQKLSKRLRQHKMEVQYPEDLTLVKIDFRLMEHAISNLILNAVMYTPIGSVIKVFIEKSKTELILHIQDNGSGVPSEYADKIFEKFYRVPGSPTGGTGLGLSIVKNIIELHKGHIRYENNIPHGAKFIITLPLEKVPHVPTEAE